MSHNAEFERQCLDVDIACVGFGPATAGFLETLSRALVDSSGQVVLESPSMPGMPLQVVCYERAGDTSFGVSGVVSRARSFRRSFPDLDLAQIPMAREVTGEQMLYLLDPIGASRRSRALRIVDRLVRTTGRLLSYEDHSVAIPYLPSFMRKEGGLIFSIGQLLQWASSQVMATGLIQLWPSMPVAAPIIDDDRVVGVRLLDQGTDKEGRPAPGYLPGMDVRALLTVIGDGAVGAIGQQLDVHFGLPEGHHQREWAVGMKMVIDLPAESGLQPGEVIHTFGYPEPEIFGFLYVHDASLASVGIFVPSWLDNPARTSYAYLQHWMRHPRLWRHLQGGKIRSWGAKSLQESGRRGEPRLVGDGWARIGEGSGSTNVLTGSGLDEAWATGVQLAEGVIELLEQGKPLDRAHLEQAYVARRRASWVEKESRVAERAREGFQKGFITGLLGMALTGLSGGRLGLGTEPRRPRETAGTLEEYYRGRISPAEIEEIRQRCAAAGTPLHAELMAACGWPRISHDGQLLVSHQDALLLGGKVQAPPGYADHVSFLSPALCRRCEKKLCIEICSGQAITPGEDGVPQFDREKCVHCGACLWSCTEPRKGDAERGNIEFRAGAGGLTSSEN